MTWLNEWDIELAVERWEDYPNLGTGARALDALAAWTNGNSDGWPYWAKPARASARLMGLLAAKETEYRQGGSVADLSDSELSQVLRPIKAFLTRQGADWRTILPL